MLLRPVTNFTESSATLDIERWTAFIMSAKDKYHDVVVTALEKEGWQITHDPYKLMVGKRKGYIDLGAEKLVAAEKEGQKIAVEPVRRSDKEFSG